MAQTRKHLHTVIYHTLIIGFGFVMIYPVLWLFASSFKGASEIWTDIGSLIPKGFTFENYINGWTGFGGITFSTFYLNSFIYACVGTIGSVLSSAIVAYGFGGGCEPGMSSDSGIELGRQLTFDYALVPHAGDWRQAGVYRDGMEFNHPLLARTAGTHSGELPKRWGLLDIAPQNVVVSALKPSADGTAVLRVYEATGQPTAAKLRLSATVEAAEEVNLMEDPGNKLAVADNGLEANTLIIFTSDNGPWYQGSVGGLRGRKGQTMEGGQDQAGRQGGAQLLRGAGTPVMRMPAPRILTPSASGKARPWMPWNP